MCLIIVYYSTMGELWTQPRYESLCLQVPSEIRKRIDLYKDKLSRQCRLTGKLQLGQLLKDFKLNPEITLDQLNYSETNRPYFSIPVNFDFNISHSGKMVICGAGQDVRLGLDVEEFNPVDLKENFLLWTKKEALLKAVGVGLMKDVSEAEENKFHLRELRLPGDYVAHLAVSDVNAEVILKEFKPLESLCLEL